MSDPLSLLRKAIINKSPINYSEGWYTFDSNKFLESTKTSFKRSLKDGASYYTLRDVIFFFENSEIPSAEYRKKVFLARITAIVENDRKDLIEYLTGAISTCPQIDLIAAASYTSSVQPVIPPAQIEPQSASSVAEVQQDQSISTVSKEDLSLPLISNAETSITSLPSSLKGKKRTSSSVIDQLINPIDSEILASDRKVLAELRAGEKPTQTKDTVLRNPAVDFSFVLKLYNDQVLKPAAGQNNDSEAKKIKTSENGAPASTSGSQPLVSTTPIIIVPSALTSCITTLNAVDFLEKGVFVPVDEKIKQGSKREQDVNVYRTLPDKKLVKYKVIDNHRLLRPQDWDRVVAVFALGQPWQFKDWKYSDPVELFRNALGIHLTMDDRAVDEAIQSWNCKILKVYRFKRHMDAEATNEFWALLDDFMKLRKPSLWTALHQQK